MIRNPDITHKTQGFADYSGIFLRLRRNVVDAIILQRPHVILWLPVFLAVGIGLYFSLSFELSPVFTASAFIAGLVLWLFTIKLKEGTGLQPFVFYVSTALFLVILGFTAAQWRSYQVASPILAEALRPVQVEGRIISIEELEEGKGLRLVLDRLSIEKLSPAQTPARIRLSMRQQGSYLTGQHVRVLAGLNPPSPPVMPGAFDFQQYAYFKRLGAFGFTFEAPQIIADDNSAKAGVVIERTRSAIAARIRALVDAAPASFLSALMTGKRSGISEDHWEAMRDSGLAHMLAISGLHVGMVSAIVFFTVRGGLALFPALALRRPIKKYAAFAAFVAAFFYMLLVGSTVPTVRAMLMTGIVLFAIMIDRNPFSLRLVALSAFAILLFLPEALLGASFQMSFAAVTALIFFYECIRDRFSSWYRTAGWGRRVLLYFAGIRMTTVIAGLATGLFSLYHFQQFANYSLLANFLAVPLMSFVVMPLCVFSYFLMMFGLEGVSLHFAGEAVSQVIYIAEEVAAMPSSTYTPAAMPFAVFLPLVMAALLVVILRGPLRWLCLVPFFVAVINAKPLSQEVVLFSSTGKSFALVLPQEDVMYVSSRRYDRFAQDIWARRYGLEALNIRNIRSYEDTRCDEFACRVTLPSGRILSFITHGAASAEECDDSDIVLSSEPIRGACAARYDFDLFDVRRQGAVMLTESDLQTVASARGSRPWAVTNHR